MCKWIEHLEKEFSISIVFTTDMLELVPLPVPLFFLPGVVVV